MNKRLVIKPEYVENLAARLVSRRFDRIEDKQLAWWQTEAQLLFLQVKAAEGTPSWPDKLKLWWSACKRCRQLSGQALVAV